MAKRRTAADLAVAAEVDIRTADRALDEGVEVIRGAGVRRRLTRAMAELGLTRASTDHVNARLLERAATTDLGIGSR